jgi:hypothetical protein
MKKTFLICLSLAGMATNSYAQDEPVIREKKVAHHVGVQINELVRQVFNFNSSSATAANNNPYLLVYSINSVNKGWGGRIGVGYTYRSFTDDDGVNRRETDINDMQLRAGVEKAFTLSGRWSTGIGIDGVYNLNDDRTRSVIRAFDTTTTITKTDIVSYGGGLMGWIRYNISEKVVIGTETSFYYVTGDQKQDLSVTRRSQTTGTWNTNVSKIDNELAEGIFRLPVAIYLMVRF